MSSNQTKDYGPLLGVAYGGFVTHLIKAVQELTQSVQQLRQDNIFLRQRVIACERLEIHQEEKIEKLQNQIDLIKLKMGLK